MTEGVPGLGFPVLPFSPPDYLFVAAHNRSFAATGAYRTQSYELSGVGQPLRVKGARLTASLFQVLGISPTVGRTFTQEEDEHSKRVVVLSGVFAQNAFGTPEKAVGRTILLDRTSYTVIGVMPQSFMFPIHGSRFNSGPADVFIPVSWSNDDRKQTVSNFDFSMIARLKADVTIQQANAEMSGLIQRIVEDYPPSIKQAFLQRVPNFSLESKTVPFREEFIGDAQRPLLILLAAVGIVLLIGCADVANLMFSRMVSRQKEFALRTALGAGKWRLIRQTLTEGLVLSAIGGAIGVCLAFWALPLLLRFAPENLPRLNEISLNSRMLVFVSVITLATPLFFCLGPLINTIRSAFVTQLRGEGRTATQGKHQKFVMSAAVVAQFSLAFLLLTIAGLLTRSLMKATEANPGFQPEHTITAQIALPGSSYQTRREVDSLFNRLLEQINAIPGVQQAGAISDLPMGSTSNVIISLEDHSTDNTEKVDFIFCRGSALDALRLPLIRGRLLQPQDEIGQRHSVVISETLARRISPRGDAIGRRLRIGADIPGNGEPWLTVVGIVGDVKSRLTDNTPRLLMFSPPKDWVKQMNLIVRTSGDPLLLANAVQHEIAQIDPNLPIAKMEPLDQILEQSLSAERFRTWLLICFAGAALLLATLGIAGLLAYNTAQRKQEFGVRIALGANRRDLLRLIFWHCFRLSGTGIVLGFLVSIAATRAISTLLYETSPLDPGTFLAVPSILILVAFGAALFPAWRAVRTDPITALRTE